jgi:hypothetical protein
MKFSKIELPSNKKFGYFFAAIFIIIAAYFYINKSINLTYIFVSIAIFFFLAAILKDEILLPLNKLWMRFGFLLGIIISPIVLGLIFFGLFTPIAIVMRLFGRDELRLKFREKTSHWINRSNSIHAESFKRQF